MKSALILEDIAEVRGWLARALSSSVRGVEISKAGTIAEAKLLLTQRKFDLALIDIRLPDGNGIDLIPSMRQDNPNIRCIIATIFDDDKNIFNAFCAGAYGYLLKDQGWERLKECLERILSGEPPLSPRIALRILNHFRQTVASNAHQPPLTDREKEILILIAKGLSRAEVAAAFGIGMRTVASHIGAIYRKLDITSRSEATMEALRMGLIRV